MNAAAAETTERRGKVDNDGNISAQLIEASNTGARAGIMPDAAAALNSGDFDGGCFAAVTFCEARCF